MNRNEAVQNLAIAGRLSMAHAEDLYDSLFEKPVVPKYVADWYEEHEDDFDYELWNYFSNWDDQEDDDFKNWVKKETEPIITLVSMHQFGYEVEKKPRYTVRIKATNQYLWNDGIGPHFSPGFRTDFTKTDLEKSGFGWVFDCPGVEVKEVE